METGLSSVVLKFNIPSMLGNDFFVIIQSSQIVDGGTNWGGDTAQQVRK